jgi:hypothetical protein
MDYEKIAGIIRDAREARHLGRLETVLRLQRNLSDYLAEVDPDFDEREFEVRCMSRHTSQAVLVGSHTEADEYYDPEELVVCSWCKGTNGNHVPVRSQPERQVMVVGYDGRSNPILRYSDEIGLPDHERASVDVQECKYGKVEAQWRAGVITLDERNAKMFEMLDADGEPF